MKNKTSTYYWWCQLVGWSTYCLVFIFFYYTIRIKPRPSFYPSLFLDAGIGFVVTHIMRSVIKQLKLVTLPLNKQIIWLVGLSVAFGYLYAYISVSVLDFLDIEVAQMKSLTMFNRSMRVFLGTFLYVLIWNLIYFTYHYIEKARKDIYDKIRLENVVKELELKTIKAHINPHFIFNALNSIRALVDENPGRARTAITELSNLLRSSMQAEKTEVVSLGKELAIVKDYLALEHIRFEDRLRVQYDIDEDTLDQPVPPMMLQTLVENAIKHGISKQVSGGEVKIVSAFVKDHYELSVLNTGSLNGDINKDGFGIASTQNRLALLFNGKASFELKQLDGNAVEAKVMMPVSNL